MVTLWAVTVFLAQHRPKTGWYWMTLIPALFMTMVTISFLFVAEKEGLGSMIPHRLGYLLAALVTVVLLLVFVRWHHRFVSKKEQAEQ